MAVRLCGAFEFRIGYVIGAWAACLEHDPIARGSLRPKRSPPTRALSAAGRWGAGCRSALLDGPFFTNDRVSAINCPARTLAFAGARSPNSRSCRSTWYASRPGGAELV